MMRGSSLLPKQFRSLGHSDSWLNRAVTAQLLRISHIVCQHPIHTIVVIAFLASTSYVGLLQESLFNASANLTGGQGLVDLGSLLVGSRTLELSKDTGWKWQLETKETVPHIPKGPQHLALTTLTFPDSSSTQHAPDLTSFSIPTNVSAINVPATANLLSSISQDSSLAFYMPFSELGDFLNAVQEISPPSSKLDGTKWTMKAAKSNDNTGPRSYGIWLREGWSSFVDLIKVSHP